MLPRLASSRRNLRHSRPSAWVTLSLVATMACTSNGEVESDAAEATDGELSADARIGDAGPTDLGQREDAELIDSNSGSDGPGARDTGSSDTGPPDAGSVDASIQDSDPREDAEPEDSAPEDAGALDAEDARSSDAAIADAMAPPLPAVRPVGLNMPNLLHAYLGSAPIGPSEARAQIDHARAFGFTHARFIASGYWPVEMSSGTGWIADPGAYFAAFDDLVADARARGLRLVPSLLWNLFLFPDLANEPVSRLFTPGSATRRLAEQYVTDVVTRYADDDAILFWEIGNELNLNADLDMSSCDVCAGTATPNACGGLAPSLGTPCRRTALDSFYSCDSCRGQSGVAQDLPAFTASIASLIHAIDPTRRVSTGHAYPRPSAEHLAHNPCPSCDWTEDSPAEYATTLARLHPPGVDIVSVHHYFGSDAARFGSTDETGLDLLERTASLVPSLGKELYVGEYGELREGATSGCGDEICGGDPTKASTRSLLGAMATSAVPYSALWAFEFQQFCAATPTCYTVSSGEDLIRAMQTSDRAYGSCAGRADGEACPIGQCRAGDCAPVTVARFDFGLTEADWVSWTNCSGCQPGTVSRQPGGSGPVMELTSNDLPCTSGCAYPGVYALSPELTVPSSAGELTIHFEAQVMNGSATLRLIPFDAGGAELDHSTIAIEPSSRPVTRPFWIPLPPGATRARIRAELPSADASLRLDELHVRWQP
ncbi:MAG: hypothetical protein HYV07_33245 [Deltaproteobacteria bacterium]|nr:hypothetical protein [Deltaproteobacteria bacterium]